MQVSRDFQRFAKWVGYPIGISDFSVGRRVIDLDDMSYEDSDGYTEDRDTGLLATAPYRLFYSSEGGIVTRGLPRYRTTIILPANLFYVWRAMGMPYSDIRRRMMFYRHIATDDYEKWVEGRMARDLPDRAKEAYRKEMDTYRRVAKFTDEWMTHDAPYYQKKPRSFVMGGG